MKYYWVQVSLFCLGSLIRTGYELLGERGSLRANKALLLLVFAAMTALWASWFRLCETDVWTWQPPQLARFLGLVTTIVGTLFVIGSVGQLFLRRSRQGLVTSGLFAKLRHPMYAGFALWYAGYPLYHGAVTGSVLGALGLAQLWIWCAVEERKLTRDFGPEYEAYRARTWC